ncbi:MAG TPA: heavy-metal-associated domain-containing protein [Candidatus Kapabacteria bacterium]|nr:heavy-metal-associated domain-containing protein [Candidatus Kapabacteria bacterium]
MTEKILIIEGMHCSGCVRSVTDALKRVPGVQNVEVSLPEKRAVVFFDETEPPFADLNTAVAEAGYTAYEYAPA